MKDAGRAALVTIASGVTYGVFLGHRSDYLGHFLAGFGGTLGLLTLFSVILRKSPAWATLVGVALAIGLGIYTESTVFKLAIFDPVDFFNQSLGATLAGLSLVGRRVRMITALMLFAIAGAALLAGFYFAFA